MGNEKTDAEREQVTNIEDMERRNAAAAEGLDIYFANVVRECEIPCNWSRCGTDWDACTEDCEWYDFDSVGIWQLTDDERLEELYNSAGPEGCAANPFRYSSVIGEWIVPGAFVPWVSGNSLPDMMDEYEMLASLCFSYRFVGGSMHDHSHSFSGVVGDLLRDPVRFYIPIWAEADYSEQEKLFLEVVRERLCHDMGVVPKVDIVWADEEDEKKQKEMQGERKKSGGGAFEMRVRAHIAEMRAETEAKLAEAGADEKEDGRANRDVIEEGASE